MKAPKEFGRTWGRNATVAGTVSSKPETGALAPKSRYELEDSLPSLLK